MKSVAVKKNGEIILENVGIADNFVTRFKGLMFKKSLPEKSGLYIVPCNQIHMFNMRFPLDVIYVDKEYRIVHTDCNVLPWRVCKTVKSAHGVIEINAGLAEKLSLHDGDYLEFEPVSDEL